MSHIKKILSARFPNRQIVVDVDCSWIACVLGRGKNPEEIASATATFLLTLAHASGFIVCPIFDKDSRHHSKRVSTKRRSARERDRIDSA